DNGLDAAALFSLAEWHGVTPLVWASLSGMAGASLPIDLSASFEAAVRGNALRNLNLIRRLDHVLDLLQTHGIPCLPYKGPALAGRPWPAFAPARLLLILCVHGANHCWLRLNWLCDVAELLRRNPALDWPALAAEAERWGCRRILTLGLLLAHDLLDAPLPPA